MKPSVKQAAIYDCWQKEDSNILISAVAGSGKTTTLMEILAMCEYRTLFLAFNKSIQMEIQEKIDSRGLAQGKAMTLHSLGFRALMKNYSKVIVKNGKKYGLLKEVEKRNQVLFKALKWEDKAKLYYTLYDLNDYSRLFLTNDITELYGYFKEMGKTFFDLPELPIVWQDFIDVREESYVGPVIEIDFTDMIYLPVHKDFSLPINTVYLMVDECQDLNLCQHKLVDKLVSQGVEKWIAVGDPNQSIYGFSGASSKSFDIFKTKDKVKELPLDICYRCPSDIVDKANEIYPIMTGYKTSPGVISTVIDKDEIQEGSLVICRNSGPLISLYFQLISQGRKVFIKGDDIISTIVKFCKPYNYKTISQATNKMEKELLKLKKKSTEDTDFKVFIYTQNFDNFKLIAQHLSYPNGDVKDLIETITDIFKQEGDGTTLCTIHKSKGLEANVVYILNEFLIPSKFAISEEQLIQERNLKYVARTRAKEELHFLNIK